MCVCVCVCVCVVTLYKLLEGECNPLESWPQAPATLNEKCASEPGDEARKVLLSLYVGIIFLHTVTLTTPI